jgi:hypothetical protein
MIQPVAGGSIFSSCPISDTERTHPLPANVNRLASWALVRAGACLRVTCGSKSA